MLDINAAGPAASEAFNREFGAGRTTYVHCDVTDTDAFRRSFETVADALGPLDIVFNNAGIGAGATDLVVNINLTSVIHGTYAALEVGGVKGCSVVSLSVFVSVFLCV